MLNNSSQLSGYPNREKERSEYLLRRKYYLTAQSWFLRSSWPVRLQYLKTLFNMISSVEALKLLSTTLQVAKCKEFMYREVQFNTLNQYDQALQDNNRVIDQMKKPCRNFLSDVKWFHELAEMEKVKIFIGFLIMGGGAMYRKLYIDIKDTLKRELHLNRMVQELFPKDNQVEEEEIEAESQLKKTKYDVGGELYNPNDPWNIAVEAMREKWSIHVKAYKKKLKIEPKESKKKAKSPIKRSKSTEKSKSPRRGSKSRKKTQSREKSLKSALKKSATTEQKKPKKKRKTSKDSVSFSSSESRGSKKSKRRKGSAKSGSTSKASRKTAKGDRSRKKTKGDSLDQLQFLPVWINKLILMKLDAKSLQNMRLVNAYWSYLVKDLENDRKVRNYLNKTIKELKKKTDAIPLQKDIIPRKFGYVSHYDNKINALAMRGATEKKLRENISKYTIGDKITSQITLVIGGNVFPLRRHGGSVADTQISSYKQSFSSEFDRSESVKTLGTWASNDDQSIRIWHADIL